VYITHYSLNIKTLYKLVQRNMNIVNLLNALRMKGYSIKPAKTEDKEKGADADKISREGDKERDNKK
jgi:hypothetical protein